jgi:hypothetical protein
MAQMHPALGASARMTRRVVSFPLIAGLLLLKPVVDAVCAYVLVFGLVAAVGFALSVPADRWRGAGVWTVCCPVPPRADGARQRLAERRPRQPEQTSRRRAHCSISMALWQLRHRNNSLN